MPSNHIHADTITKLVTEDHKIHDLDNIKANLGTNEPSKEVLGPSVNLSDSALFGATDRKPTIGVRKPQPRKAGVIIHYLFVQI